MAKIQQSYSPFIIHYVSYIFITVIMEIIVSRRSTESGFLIEQIRCIDSQKVKMYDIQNILNIHR